MCVLSAIPNVAIKHDVRLLSRREPLAIMGVP
jgi:hypothetical protein